MTWLGVALAIITVGVLLWRPRHFSWVLAGAAAFPSSAAIVAGGVDLSCYHAAAGVAVVLVGLRLVSRRGRARVLLGLRSLDRWILLGLVGYGVLITAVGPVLFAGLPVFTPRLGIDAQVSAMTPLTFTTSNVAQAAYLVLNAGALVYLAAERDVSRRLFELTIAIVGAVSLAVAVTGPFWPSALFDTMDYRYVTGMGRLRGTFSEPSMLGLFLAGALAYCIVQIVRARGRRLVWLLGLLVVLVATAALNRSGTLVVAFGIWATAAAVVSATKWVLRSPSPKRVSLVAVAASVMTVSACTPVGRSIVLQLSGNKVGSLSFRNRSAADARGLGIAMDSWGLGVGLGSNRASSLLATMLSTIGVIGTVLLIALITVLVVRGLRVPAAVPLSSALVAVTIAHVSSIPDLSSPYLWILLGMVGSATAPARSAPRHLRSSRNLQTTAEASGPALVIEVGSAPEGDLASSAPTRHRVAG